MAFLFNGSNQYVSASSSPVGVNEPITFACWYLSTDANVAQWLVGVCKKQNDTGAFYATYLDGRIANDPIYAIKYNGVSAATATITPGYTANIYESMVGVFASDTSRTGYLNGNATADTTSRSDTAQSFDVMSIGVLLRPTLANYMVGRIAEAAIWSAALTADEVNSLAKGFSPRRIRPQSLVFYAPLIRNLQDVRAGLALTNNNTATVADHPRVY